MGYCTTYELVVDGVAVDSGVDEHPLVPPHVRKNLDDRTKWYRHDEDMISLSKQHPNSVYVLYGEGEESHDQWVKVYKAGKFVSRRATVSYAPWTDEDRALIGAQLPTLA